MYPRNEVDKMHRMIDGFVIADIRQGGHLCIKTKVLSTSDLVQKCDYIPAGKLSICLTRPLFQELHVLV